MEEEKKGFVIKDRRLFTEEGTTRSEAPAEEPARPISPEAERAGGGGPAEPAAEAVPLQEVNFADFILSLGTSAMFQFGDFPDPVTKENRKNLPAAKQTIDLLTLLKTKTEGNLTAEEKDLLEGLLFELRMRFVKEMSAK